MMLHTLPWSEVVLGVAAALAILAVYDGIYVWPIHRRISALTERCTGQLELATEARSYEQTIGRAERGEASTRLISCFGLTEGGGTRDFAARRPRTASGICPASLTRVDTLPL